jgi:hypothetical protein
MTDGCKPRAAERVFVGFKEIRPRGGDPVLVLYGERAYLAACGLTYRDYVERVALPDGLGADDSDLPYVFSHLAGRSVVLWPPPGADGRALAQAHATIAADAGAFAAGVVVPPDDWPDDFALGDKLPDGAAPRDIAYCVERALSEAAERALPMRAHHPKAARAVAPALAPIDGAELFARLRAFLAAHLAEPQTTLDTLALWCLAAWAHDAFDVSPRLVLHANDPRAAHARALRLAAWLTPSPLVVSRTIAAHLLPVIAEDKPTLLLDDVGGTMLGYIDMRALIAAGALRDGAFLGARTYKNPSGHLPCFSAMAIATTSRVPADVHVRAIVLALSPPASDGAACTALPLADPPHEVLSLRADMQRWANDAREAFAPPEAILRTRQDPASRENWHPLNAVAYALGVDAVRAAADAMKALSASARRLSSDLELLEDVRELVGPIDVEARVPTLELLAKLVSDPERAWATAHRGRKLTARGLADRMDRFGVRPIMMRLPGGAGARGYSGENLLAAFARYLGDPIALDQPG